MSLWPIEAALNSQHESIFRNSIQRQMLLISSSFADPRQFLSSNIPSRNTKVQLSVAITLCRLKATSSNSRRFGWALPLWQTLFTCRHNNHEIPDFTGNSSDIAEVPFSWLFPPTCKLLLRQSGMFSPWNSRKTPVVPVPKAHKNKKHTIDLP